MKRQLLNRLIALALLLVGLVAPVSVAAPAQSQRWETVETVIAELSDESVDVAVREQYVYVFTPQPVNIKLFTILGQLVSQASLPAGTSRLKVSTRGIYILKAGTVTRRITI